MCKFTSGYLLVITEENLDRQPAVTTDLEAVLEVIQLMHLVSSQVPAIKLKVLINALLVDRLGDNAPALLQTPLKKHLLRGLALLLGDLQQGLILVQRGVGGSKARVACGMNTLGGVVGHKLGRRVVWVEFDLVHGRNDLGAWVIEKFLQVLDAEVGNSDVADLACSGELLYLLPGSSC